MARGKKRSVRRGKAAKLRGAARHTRVTKKTATKTSTKTAKRGSAKSKTRKKVAKTKRALAKRAAPKSSAPSKAAKSAREIPIEVLKVETVEEVVPGVALVTDYEFISVPGSSPSGLKKKDGGTGQ